MVDSTEVESAESIADVQTSWTLPTINVSSAPKAIYTGTPLINRDYPENYFRSAKWSPDGSLSLAQCEDRTFQMLKLPTELIDSSLSFIHPEPVFPQSAPILDFKWYPGAKADYPGTYCFLASVRECPVKLLDASDGRLRASYRIVDHRERQVAPHSMAFNSTASHFYCGYEDAIEVFDFQYPGEGTKLPTTPSKKSRDGMKGIVSSIAFCPDYSGLFAASSFSAAITLYSEATGADPILILDGMKSAITQVLFNPANPQLLYASQRRSDEILCWDIRYPFEVLRSFKRRGSSTNQKLIFDIDVSGHWLATGDECGDISMYDINSDSPSAALKFRAHDDAIGSVAFNPIDSSLISVSGSRHYVRSVTSGTKAVPDSMLDSESTDSSTSDEEHHVETVRYRTPKPPFTTDSSAKIWSFQTGVTES